MKNRYIKSFLIGLSSVLSGLCIFTACKIETSAIGTYTDPSGITFTYAPYEDTKTCMIRHVDVAQVTDITVPMEIEGYTVTKIDGRAFQDCRSLTSVTLPDGVRSIGTDAFDGCYNLTSLTLGKDFQSISFEGAFEGCDNLTNVYYTGDVAGWCGIYGLEDLMKSNPTLYVNGSILKGDLVVPDGVTNIENSTFAGCSSLTSVTLPDGVKSIGNSTFAGCSSLTSITLPDSVKSIGNSAFAGCSSLTSVSLPNAVKSINENTFDGCSSLTSIDIPDSVNSLGEFAFSGCSSLTSLTVPHSVGIIGEGAFSSCSGLTSIAVDKDNPVYHSDGNCLIATLQKRLLIGCKNSVIPADGSVTCIDGAFRGCSGLTSVTLPDTVKSLGNAAFEYCDGLTSVTLPDSVTSIGRNAFAGCSSLTSVSLPGSVTQIGDDAFRDCGNLKDVYYTGDLASWCSISFHAFDSNPLKYARNFYVGNELITELVLPDNVTLISDKAFCGYARLTSVVVSDGATSVGNLAFYQCNGLKSVVIGNGVTSIGYEAFRECEALESVVIGNDLEKIGGLSFSGCTALKSVVIGRGVKEIGALVFRDCNSLEGVYYCGTASDWDDVDHKAALDEPTIPRFDYSESQPTGEGNYWHYVDGVPTAW